MKNAKTIIMGAQNSGKTTLSEAIMLKTLANGGEIDLGCDPCVTYDGASPVA